VKIITTNISVKRMAIWLEGNVGSVLGVGGNSWREMEGRLKHGTFFMTSMWQRLSLPSFM